MNNFEFYSPTEFVFGKGREKEAGEIVTRYNGKRILLVYGRNSVIKSGLLANVEESLKKANIDYKEFGGVQANPTVTKAREGIIEAKTYNPDMVLAIGGGSVIDTAKAIAVGYFADDDIWNYYTKKSIAKKSLKIGVILTIPAAGSEGSGNSVLTNVETNQKLGLRMPNLLRPIFAIMNPELTFTLPAFQTACGITDMMAHIMERYFTNTPDVIVTDEFCEGLLRAIIKEAPKVISDGNNYEARANIMWAGTIAHNGVCGVGREEDWTSHAIEHEFSAIDDNIAHGAGLAVIFPAFLDFARLKNPNKIAQMGHKVFDINELDNNIAAKKCVEELRCFFSSIGMPVTLKELGAEHISIDKVAEHLQKNSGDTIGFYVKLTMDDVKALLVAVKE